MGCCCGGSKPTHPEEGERFEKGGANDLYNGPAGNRGCTDPLCLLLLLAAWVVYIAVTFAGFSDGEPAKLYLPRDFGGAYCGLEKNWNDGPNTKDFAKLSFTMNATSTTDLIVKQLLCSSAVSRQLVDNSEGGLLTRSEEDDYLCSCCLVPCSKCRGSFEVGDLTDASSLSSGINGKMTELKGKSNPGNLFSPAGANGDFFTNMWSEATKYFNAVCLPDCNTNFASMTGSSASTPRTWTYFMAPDNDLSPYWEKLKKFPVESNNLELKAIQDTINSEFTFQALPESLCPYNASKCIPFPGIQFKEASSGYCQFEMAADVTNAIGTAAAESFVSLGGEAFQENLTETFGVWVGDFLRSIDAFILMALCCFVIGFVYMVFLRFLVGVCVWFAVFLVLIMLFLGGAACWVKSFQCAGVGLLETGRQATVAVAVTAQVAAENTASGTAAVSEELKGDNGELYTGVQYRTVDGYQCVKWGEGIASDYTAAKYSILEGASNYCRNPFLASDKNKGDTIWCFTTDPLVRWQECQPVGVIKPKCANGYDVNNADIRKVLEICGYVIWGLGGIYVVLVLCLVNRIRLAIAVNKVAAIFVSHTPRILIVPIAQAFVGVVWILVWGLSITFLISQVPDNYTEKGGFETYAVAYGTSTTPGKCNDVWPQGSVYRDDDRCDTTVNGTAACWRCAPPRYVFDARFAASFFVFLWNNALNVAIGQCIIAGAVGVWFFTPNKEKGNKRAIAPACWNVFRYHLGSLAFGSFIIAMVQFIRYVMKYYEKQAKAQKNRVLVLILKICQCCMWCLEKCLKFLNKNAYIQIALLGTNFCTSAKKAFFLIMRNALRFSTVALLGTMISWIGFFFISIAGVAVGYLIVSGLHPEMSLTINLIIYAITAYLIAQLFMQVFGLAVDSTLQCFLACEEMGMGGDFVPEQMKRWLNAGPDADVAKQYEKEIEAAEQ
eukprot:TRINITY_DN7231_c0_g2_i1.p1 TRINITY_DN7231_c0_g2~~TRINITY_DN7231_c0_g2_i1.p1  ORF type:complete len:949 (+),score=198.10 TRINITY_DN7231_c0_g2_i1:115-2961(+)